MSPGGIPVNAARDPASRSILIVSHETTLSGAPILLAHLIGQLKAEGWAPTVITPEEGPAADLFRAQGAELIVEPQLLIDPHYKALRQGALGFDVILANTLATWQAVQSAHLENVPVVWYLHETEVGRQLMEQIPMLQPSLGLANVIVTPTRRAAEVYQPFSPRPVEVVPHGYPDLKAGPRDEGRPFTFLTLATYEARKGQDVLAEAILRLDPDLRWRALFQMAGRPLDQAFRDEVRARTEKILNVQMLGPLAHAEALRLLGQADVLVCASRDETMPITLVEAMSMGKALIATDVGGIGEWLRDGENALIVPPENPEALAAALARCLTDRELVKRIGLAARKTFVEHFDLARYGERFVEVLESAIGHGQRAGTPDRYAEWVELYATLGPADRATMRRDLAALPEQPLISILLPVYNPDLPLLQAAIDSVKQQIYERWELCVADDASTDAKVKPFLQRMAAQDPRIRVTFRERNGHMAACSNSALALAAGEWSALLDQDDALPEDALAQVALEIAAHPDAGLIYTDEDKIDVAGARSNPFFKTDWNPELFRAQNYIGHLGLYRTATLREIGGFREGYEGSQDYDLALRCLERLEPSQVRHLPRVLYHWRMIPGSLAAKRDAKTYAKDAARKALNDHLQRLDVAGRAVPCPENIESHRVIYDLPSPAPAVSVIIMAAKGEAPLRACIDKLRAETDYPDWEIVVVMAGPASDPRLPRELEDEGVKICRAEPTPNEARLRNLGAAAARRGAILVFMEAELEAMERDWLRELASYASRPQVGVVGSRVWFGNDTLREAGYVMGLGGIASRAHHALPRGHAGFFNRTFLQRNCSAVSWSGLAVSAEVFRELGGFDEKNLMGRFQEIDFCLRVTERDWQVVWTPYSNLLFRGSVDRPASSATEVAIERQDEKYMRERWGEKLRSDPFYSPNLSLALPGFELAFPPAWFDGE